AGLVSALAPATVLFTARLGAFFGTAVLEVTPAVPTQVRVLPTFASLTVGESLPMSAVATLSDGSEIDVTAQSTWASDHPDLATVSSAGVVTAVAVTPPFGMGIEATYQNLRGGNNIEVTPGSPVSAE